MSRNPGQGNFGPPDPKEFFEPLRARHQAALDKRIADVLLGNSFGKFKEETGQGFTRYAAFVAPLIREALHDA